MEIILNLISKIILAAILMLIAYLTPKVKAWLTEKVGEARANKLMAIIFPLCKAAEQLYKETDDTGNIRHGYVLKELEKLGIAVTEEVEAFIESCVFDINRMPLDEYFDDDWTDYV